MRLPLAIVAVLVAALLAPPAASACSCAGPAQGEKREFYVEALKRSDAAITGKVVRRRVIRDESAEGIVGPGEAILTYRVRRAFKKKRRFPRGRKVRVRTSGSGASCGIEQRVGTVGGIFLHRSRKGWGGGLCDQVSKRNLRRAAKDRDSWGPRGSGAGGCSAT